MLSNFFFSLKTIRSPRLRGREYRNVNINSDHAARLNRSFGFGFQVAQVPVSQNSAAPVPVGYGQQAFRADQHAVGRDCRPGRGTVVAVAANDAAHVSAGTRRRSQVEEDAQHPHSLSSVSDHVLSGRIIATTD